MPGATQHCQLSDRLAVARVARWLWVHAGSPPGRYAEYWAKVEPAMIAARQAQTDRATAPATTEQFCFPASPDKAADPPAAG